MASLRERQAARLTAVRRAFDKGKATARDVEEVLKTCTVTETEIAAERTGHTAGSFNAITRKSAS
jgi:hypothetical protein